MLLIDCKMAKTNLLAHAELRYHHPGDFCSAVKITGCT